MSNLICCKCKVELENTEVKFSYLDREMKAVVPKCPVCGQVHISAELVTNKINKVEVMLEEK